MATTQELQERLGSVKERSKNGVGFRGVGSVLRKPFEFVDEVARSAPAEPLGEGEVPEKWLKELKGLRRVYEISRDYPTAEAAKKANPKYEKFWKPGLAKGRDHRVVLDFKNQTVSYVPEKEAAKLEDNPNFYVCDTSGEAIQALGTAYDVEPKRIASDVAGRLGIEKYPSNALGIGASIIGGVVAPRTARMWDDDEARARFGGQTAAIVGDVAEGVASFIPVAGTGLKLGRGALKTAESVDKLRKVARPLRKAADMARLGGEGKVISRAAKGALMNAADNELINAGSAIYDAALGTSRGYQNTLSDDIVAATTGALGRALTPASSDATIKSKIFDIVKNKGKLNKVGWKSIADVPDDWVDFYKGKLQDNDFQNAPLVPFGKETVKPGIEAPSLLASFGEDDIKSSKLDEYIGSIYYKDFGFNSPDEFMRDADREKIVELVRNYLLDPMDKSRFTYFNPDYRDKAAEVRYQAAKHSQNAKDNPLATRDAAHAYGLRNYIVPENEDIEDAYKKAAAETAIRYDLENLRGKYREEKPPLKNTREILGGYIIPALGKNLGKYDKGSFIDAAMEFGGTPLPEATRD